MKQLREYLERLNDVNQYDLDAEWVGSEDKPLVRVFEESDDHELCCGPEVEIVELVRESLGFWGLEDA